MGPPRGTGGEVPSYAGPGMCGEGRRKAAEIQAAPLGGQLCRGGSWEPLKKSGGD